MQKEIPVPQPPTSDAPPDNAEQTRVNHQELLDTDPRLTFLIHEHQYLLDMTRFADQKAAFIFAFGIGVVTLCYNLKLYDPARSVAEWDSWSWLASMGAVFVLISAALSVWTLLPRLLTHKAQGIVYFQHVSSYASHAAYASAVLASLDIDFVNELSSHCYTLAQIAQAKFAHTKYSIYAGVIGSLLVIGAALGVTASSHKRQLHQPLAQVDHAGATVVAALDVELPAANLVQDVAALGVELKSVSYKELTVKQQKVLEKFRSGYLTTIQLTKATKAASDLKLNNLPWRWSYY